MGRGLNVNWESNKFVGSFIGATLVGGKAFPFVFQGKHVEVNPLSVGALEILGSAVGEQHPDSTSELTNQMLLLSVCPFAFLASTTFVLRFGVEFQAKYEEAERLYQRSVAIREYYFGPDYPAVATTLNDWATLLASQVRGMRRRCFVEKR